MHLFWARGSYAPAVARGFVEFVEGVSSENLQYIWVLQHYCVLHQLYEVLAKRHEPTGRTALMIAAERSAKVGPPTP